MQYGSAAGDASGSEDYWVSHFTLRISGLLERHPINLPSLAALFIYLAVVFIAGALQFAISINGNGGDIGVTS